MTIERAEASQDSKNRFTLMYDGECPLCCREVNWLCRRAPSAINPVDISSPDFDSESYGLNEPDVHRELHGIKPDGTITVGMESVREAYRAVGLGFMVSFTAHWPFRPFADWMYRRFAANRLKIGSWLGRRGCTSNTCQTPTTPPKP